MERRNFWLTVLCFVMFAELSSWITSGPNSALCLIEPQHNAEATNDNEEEYCPTFFAGSLLLGRRGFEWVKRDENDKAVVAGFTVVLAISTIGLWFATNSLYRAGERQLEFLRESSDTQSREMQASIAAAREANRISSEAMHTSQRAWVSPDIVPDSDLTWDAQGCRLVVKMAIKNIGVAPAQDVNVHIRVYARPNESPVSIEEALLEPRSPAIGHFLFPNGDVAPSKKLLLTRKEISDCGNPNQSIVIIQLAVGVRYLATPDRKEGRTVKLYRLIRFCDSDREDGVTLPRPIKMDENIAQDRLILAHHWMPSYAD